MKQSQNKEFIFFTDILAKLQVMLYAEALLYFSGKQSINILTVNI